MNVESIENIARLEPNGDSIRLTIHYDVSKMSDEEKRIMLHNCLRTLAVLERDCYGKKLFVLK